MKLLLSEFGPAALQKRHRAYLIYGHHLPLQTGLLAEIEPMARTISEEALLQNPEMHTSVGLFESPPFLIVQGVHEKQKAFYDHWIRLSEITLVLVSTRLKAQSLFVKEFLRSADIGVVGCYEPCMIQSERILKRYLHSHQITPPPSLTTLCAEIAIEGTWKSVSQMLALYPDTLTHEVICDLFPQTQTAQYWPFSDDILNHLTQLASSEDTALGLEVIRNWQTLYLQAWQVFFAVDKQKTSIHEAISNVKPFFKHEPWMMQSSRWWNRIFFQQGFSALLKAELEVKAQNMALGIGHLLTHRLFDYPA
jgi:hypothetical protein